MHDPNCTYGIRRWDPCFNQLQCPLSCHGRFSRYPVSVAMSKGKTLTDMLLPAQAEIYWDCSGCPRIQSRIICSANATRSMKNKRPCIYCLRDFVYLLSYQLVCATRCVISANWPVGMRRPWCILMPCMDIVMVVERARVPAVSSDGPLLG
jgi:hypothetical protein